MPENKSLDLAPILARLEERERTTISPWSFTARRLWSEPLDEAIRDDIRALVAEVEHLRAELARRESGAEPRKDDDGNNTP